MSVSLLSSLYDCHSPRTRLAREAPGRPMLAEREERRLTYPCIETATWTRSIE